jgi:competence protein ComEC
MLTVGLAAIVLRRRARPVEGMAAAAIAVLLLDPLAPLTPGFWLSFGAVAAILWRMCARLGGGGRVHVWLRLQLGIAVALTPLLIVFFGRSALVAPLANLIAVPWVSVAVVPPALAGAVLAAPWAEAAAVMLTLADTALRGLWSVLEPLARLPFAQWDRPAPPLGSLLLAGLGAVWLLAPRGTPEEVLQTLREAFARLPEDKTYVNLMERLGEDPTTYMDGAAYEELRPKQSEAFQQLIESFQG